MATLKMPLSQRRRLARDLEQKFARQQMLLAEAAAAFVAQALPVPPEIGQAIGAVTHRARLFNGIARILCETTTGIGVKSRVEQFLQEIEPHNQTIARALEAIHAQCPLETPDGVRTSTPGSADNAP